MSKQVLKIAFGVFIGILAAEAALHISEIRDYVVGELTGWDAAAKAQEQENIEANQAARRAELERQLRAVERR